MFSCIPKSQIKKQFQKRIYQKCQDNFADFKQCIKKNTDESGKISWNKVRAKFPYLIYINLWENYNNSKEAVLDVTMKQQEGRNICWAASSQCLLKYIFNNFEMPEINATQDELYNLVKGNNSNYQVTQEEKDASDAADDGSIAICQIIKMVTGIDCLAGKMKQITPEYPETFVKTDVALRTLKEAILGHNAPVMVNTGGHWIVVNGIDFENKTISYKNPYPVDGMQANDQITVSQDDFFNQFGGTIAYVWYDL